MSGRGSTWDTCTVLDLYGNEHTGHLDTSSGHYFYFEHLGQWRKARIDVHMTGRDNNVDFRKTGVTP